MSEFIGLLHRPRRTNYQGLIDNLLRKATPDRVYFMELFHDREVRDALADRFGLADGLDPSGPDFARRKTIAVNRFCGFDHVSVHLAGRSASSTMAPRWTTQPRWPAPTGDATRMSTPARS